MTTLMRGKEKAEVTHFSREAWGRVPGTGTRHRTGFEGWERTLRLINIMNLLDAALPEQHLPKYSEQAQ